MKYVILVVLSIIVLIAMSRDASSQVRIDRAVISSGASDGSNSGIKLVASVGQAIIGQAQTQKIRGSFGFWYTLGGNPVSVEQIPYASIYDVVFHQNYPNPVISTASIPFSLRSGAQVSLTIHTLLGEQISFLANRYYEAGYHSAVFNARGLPPGTYLCRLQVGEKTLLRTISVSR